MRVSAKIMRGCRKRRRGSTRSLAVVGLLILSSTLMGCGVIKKKPEGSADEFSVVGKPMPPEKAKAVLNEVGSNFAYGPGLGSAAVNLGTAIVFPPYIIYLVGNTALSLSGYEPVTISSVLPEDEGKAWSDGYDYVVSGPGKMAAAVAGREYRSREVADDRLKTLLNDETPEDARAQMKGK